MPSVETTNGRKDLEGDGGGDLEIGDLAPAVIHDLELGAAVFRDDDASDGVVAMSSFFSIDHDLFDLGA